MKINSDEKRKLLAVILAAGSGKRLGKTVPKAFIEVEGKAMLMHSVEKFNSFPEIERVLIVAPDGKIDETRKMAGEYENGYYEYEHQKDPQNDKNYKKNIIIKGGASRQESLANAIRWISENFEYESGLISVITHDAARPFVPVDLIAKHVKAAKEGCNISTVFPSADTLVISRDKQSIDQMPPRSVCYGEQTPQTFVLSDYEEALNTLSEEELAESTDAIRILHIAGKPVSLMFGVAENIKITYPRDLETAK